MSMSRQPRGAEANAQEMLVDDGERFSFERRQRLRCQPETRVPRNALTDILTGQPIENVAAIPCGYRRLWQKRIGRIAAEEFVPLALGDETAEDSQLNRIQEEETAANPTLTVEVRQLDGFVVAIDVTQTNREAGDRLQHRRVQQLEIADVQGIECARRKVDQVVRIDVTANESNSTIET